MLIAYFVPVKEFANLGKGNCQTGLGGARCSGRGRRSLRARRGLIERRMKPTCAGRLGYGGRIVEVPAPTQCPDTALFAKPQG